MKKGKLLLYNTVLLTGVSLYMRSAGLIFQVFISNRIGAAGIGLFSLVLSVQSLAVTVATSGIRYTVTRLVSEELGLNRTGAIGAVMKRCFAYSLFFSVAAAFLLFNASGRIGAIWVGDERTVLSLKILAFGLPFLSLSSVMSGYFTAVSRVAKSSAVQVFEQLFMIACTFILIPYVPDDRTDLACAAIVVAAAAADAAAFIFCSILYLLDRRKHGSASSSLVGISSRLLQIAGPLALSAYARTALSTLQHLLVPGGLKKSGISADAALASYGIIQGMAFPLLTFPSAFFFSVSELLIPELTEAQVSGNRLKMNAIVNRMLSVCLAFSIACAGIIYAFGDELGFALYNTAEAGRYIKLLAPLVVVMYMDTVADGMLKGLGQHLYSMAINIADALTSVLMVYFLLPVWAINAYLFIIFLTELFNFAFSIARLSRVVTIKTGVSEFLKPAICVFSSVQCSMLLLRIVNIPLEASVLSAGLHIAFSSLLYAAFQKILFPDSFKLSQSFVM